ncbi:MAG: cytochrome C oxidase subunit I [Candidatus Protistobacter heckmanni]|nr:cytochrome C oxidase subunit I [Candidatus Protistobacter heckmanni]
MTQQEAPQGAQHQPELIPSTPGAEQSECGGIDARTGLGRVQMLLLLLVCAAPVIASYFTYYVVKPGGGKTNYGMLVQPQRPIPEALAARDENGVSAPLAQVARGKWLLFSVDGAKDCGEPCAKKLFIIRQLRLGLNQDAGRVIPAWLVTDDAPIDPRVLSAYGDDRSAMRFLRVDRAALAAWMGVDGELADGIYLVDQRGNYMMHFPGAPEPARMLKDLAKLLKWNHTSAEGE